MSTSPGERSIETRRSTKTTEFFVYLAAVAAIVVTAFVVGDDGETPPTRSAPSTPCVTLRS